MELLTISEAAKVLNVSYKTMYRWVTAGDIPIVKLPSVTGHRGIVRIRMQDLEEFIEFSIPGHISGHETVPRTSNLATRRHGQKRDSAKAIKWFQRYAK